MNLSLRKSMITDRQNNTIEHGVRSEQRPVSGGRATLCLVSAQCEAGFDPDSAILLYADLPDAPYLAIENHSPFWCRPVWGDDLSSLPDRVQELLIRDGDGYLAILPLCGDVFKTVICGTEEGLAFRMYANTSVTDCREQPAFLWMRGDHPLSLLFDIAEAAGAFLGLPMRKERPVADVFNTFGWCSWDAMQIRVNHAGLLEKIAEFREKKVPVRFAILDDMWADVPTLNEIPADASFGSMVSTMHKSKLRSFEGDPVRFPNGMKAAIDDLHRAGIPNVGVWFPTTGYWAGLEPGSVIEAQEAGNLVTTEAGQRIVSPETEKAQAYFGDLCRTVKSWGADFVKIDNQGFHSRYRGIAPIGQSAKAIQNAIDDATDDCFGGALINCMGMPSECMFNRRSAISRCSDDFMPESREWFAKNILQCAYNGLLQGQFYVNDWDMWWTDDEQAAKNSLCRAISGGPIYVSDKIGRTRPEVLKPLLLRNGRIIRPDESATPTEDCLMENPTKTDKIFKIRNRIGENGLVAVFNIQAENRSVSGFVSPENACLPTGTYAYYESFTKTAGILQAGEEIPVRLENRDEFRLYTFVPMKNGVAALGRLDLFMGIGAIEKQDGNQITLCEAGTTGFVSERPLTFTDENGNAVPCERKGMLSVLNGKVIRYAFAQ
ncbi:MAG: hypothetical protein II955_05545 [Clostridia bacterium]|nr:hypothetical protein [Clostridia bacterium]